MRTPDGPRLAELAAAGYAVLLAILAVVVSFPSAGELLFRGYFVQDADEIIRAWYGRCALENPSIIPYSHLSMPAWTAILTVTEQLGRLLGLPLTTGGRLVTVCAAWLCLRSAAAWIRALGGTERHALLGVVLIAATPGFFLMSLTIYPSVTLCALMVTAGRFWSEDRLTAAALTLAWAPLIRWEGALLVGLLGVMIALRRAWRALGWLLAPYALYLVSNAIQYGNPWKPLAFRTTKHMGAWLIMNPEVTWERMGPALWSMVALYSPVVLVGALALVPIVAWTHRSAMGPVVWAYAGLTVALLSIQHTWMVWALRVLVTPTVLGVLVVVGLAARLPSARWGQVLLGAAALGTVVSIGMAWWKINNATLRPAGHVRAEPGFHMAVRNADASEAHAWLLEQEGWDWVLSNHLNANLLRADATCRLYELPLRLGNPRMSLDRGFKPTFGLPPGRGLAVFHTAPYGMDDCRHVRTFQGPRLQVFACEGTTGASEQ